MLASDDMVAIDAVSAWLMGFDPMRDVDCIRIAHERGLGIGDVREIEVVGEDVSELNFQFQVRVPLREPRRPPALVHAARPHPDRSSSRRPSCTRSSGAPPSTTTATGGPSSASKRMADIATTPWGRLFAAYE